MEYPEQQKIETIRKTVHRVDFVNEVVTIPIYDLVQIWAYIRWLEETASD